MDRELFKKSFLGKTVRNKGKFFDMPIQEYIVTSALYQFDPGDVTILGLLSKEPGMGSPWFTLKIAPEDFKDAIRDLDVLD